MYKDNWLFDSIVIEKSRKKYAHFDIRTDIAKTQKCISDPTWVCKHGFFPFIYFDKIFVKYNKNSGKVEKKRLIRYASHIDRCIYQYYAHLINLEYIARLKELDILGVPVAYRTDIHENNIHIAKRAFDFAKANSTCYIMVGDFTKFFDKIDHAYLKQQLCNTLQCALLPADYYAVFRSISRYSDWNVEDILRINGLTNDSKGMKTLNEKRCVLSAQQYNENRQNIKKNKVNYGIPQGSPISALLANIYMLDCDHKINKRVCKDNGLYMRYCDDFIIILPTNEFERARAAFADICEYISEVAGLELQSEKTQYFKKSGDTLSNIGLDISESSDTSQNCLNYLGFSFNGESVSLRDKTISKYYYRMRRKANFIVASKGVTKYGHRISCKNLYDSFSRKGANIYRKNSGKKNYRDGNFLTYVQRAEAIFPDENRIALVEKRHMQKIRKILKNKDE